MVILSGGLLAGGNWNNAANAGSQARNANNYRWNTNANIGVRLATRIQGYESNSLAGSLTLFAGLRQRAKYQTESLAG